MRFRILLSTQFVASCAATCEHQRLLDKSHSHPFQILRGQRAPPNADVDSMKRNVEWRVGSFDMASRVHLNLNLPSKPLRGGIGPANGVKGQPVPGVCDLHLTLSYRLGMTRDLSSNHHATPQNSFKMLETRLSGDIHFCG